MTEIPEHLLKRSRDRRSALGLGGGDAAADDGGDKPAASNLPAKAAEAAAPAASAGPAPRGKAAAVPEAPKPKPDIPVVVAAKARRRIPFWAMAGLSILPIWMFMYVRSLTVPPVEASGPMEVGAELYAGVCSSCHMGDGSGGAGRPLSNNEVNLTFPNIEDQLRFVSYATEQYQAAGVASYGDPDRPGGPHAPGSFGSAMAPQLESAGGTLSDAEVLAVVCEERHAFNPEETEELLKEAEDWCSEESPVWLALEAGATLASISEDDSLVDAEGNPIVEIPIGSGPAEGQGLG